MWASTRQKAYLLSPRNCEQESATRASTSPKAKVREPRSAPQMVRISQENPPKPAYLPEGCLLARRFDFGRSRLEKLSTLLRLVHVSISACLSTESRKPHIGS
jgi:hypothetical protein